MWIVCALYVAYGFIAPPPVAAPDAGGRLRLKVRLKRKLLWTVALLISGVSAAVLFLSVRAIAIVLGGSSPSTRCAPCPPPERDGMPAHRLRQLTRDVRIRNASRTHPP